MLPADARNSLTHILKVFALVYLCCPPQRDLIHSQKSPTIITMSNALVCLTAQIQALTILAFFFAVVFEKKRGKKWIETLKFLCKVSIQGILRSFF